MRLAKQQKVTLALVLLSLMASVAFAEESLTKEQPEKNTESVASSKPKEPGADADFCNSKETVERCPKRPGHRLTTREKQIFVLGIGPAGKH